MRSCSTHIKTHSKHTIIQHVHHVNLNLIQYDGHTTSAYTCAHHAYFIDIQSTRYAQSTNYSQSQKKSYRRRGEQVSITHTPTRDTRTKTQTPTSARNMFSARETSHTPQTQYTRSPS